MNDFQQVVSNDIYWFTDPNVSGSSEGGKLLNGGHPLTPTQTRRAANYGYTVDRMRALDAWMQRKPIWNFVEVGWPFTETAAQGARAIQPAEVTAAVWHSIIAGARGIIYFNHSFGGPNQSTALPARPGICGSARRRKEHEPTRHATCASAQRTIRGRLRQRRSIRPDDGEVP